MKKKSTPNLKMTCLFLGVMLIFSIAASAQNRFYVSPTGNNANTGLSTVNAKLTIQNAISNALDGDTINIANGMYTLTATLNLNHSLSIIGESEAGVIINATATPLSAWALNPNKSNTTLSNFTLVPNGINGGYPIHVSDNLNNPLIVLTNINLNHITIVGAKKTAFDFNGIDNLSISYLTAKNTAKGNGIQISGCTNVNADHMLTMNNAWGGLAIYVSKPYPGGVGRGSDNITIDATSSSFSEFQGVYNQDESGLFNTNIHVPGYNFMVKNNSTPFIGYTYFVPNKASAFGCASILATAPSLPGDFVGNSVMQQISNSHYIVCSGMKIQAAIDAAFNGAFIDIDPGTFVENIIVTKELAIKGKSALLTKIIPAISNPNCGGIGGGSICSGGSNVILVKANNVTIEQLTIDGDNPALNTGIMVGVANIDARNGIITDHTEGLVYTNLTVKGVTIQNVYLRGIYASTGGSFNFSDNVVSNVKGNSGSIAIFNFGGSGSITNNLVSNTSDAIASNWSKGTIYSGNTVTNSASGIHTDNNGGQGGNADLIENNQISNSSANGFGIWVFAPYRSVSVKNNTVLGVEVGLASAGQQENVTTNFIGNTIDGMNKVNSTGAYLTTYLFGFGSSNSSVSLFNNVIKNNANGFYLESELGYQLNISAHNNSISGNSFTNVTQAEGDGGAGIFTINMECNWWGTASSSDIFAKMNGTAIDYAPWLANGTDNDLVASGFQTSANCTNTIGNVLVISTTPVICYGGSTGTASISFNGGFGTITYALDGGPAKIVTNPYFTILALNAGLHSVILTDEAGNTASVSFTILQPANPISANFTFTPIRCKGGLSTQYVAFTGGTAPYHMTNQDGSVFISNASADIIYGGNTGNTLAANYTYTVTDAKGCQYVFTANIPEPTTLQVLAIATPVSCNGMASITVNAFGGVLPYSGIGTFSVSPGNYQYLVTDANGCTNTSTTINIVAPYITSATITAGSATTFCTGGSVTLTASAGSSWLWSTGATTQSILVYNAGNYSVKITNANGCSSTSTSTSVIINSLPVATITAGSAITFCSGGSVTLTASAGSSWLWSTGATTQSILVNNAGSYGVKITNSNGCIASSIATNVSINSIPAVEISVTNADLLCNKLILTANTASNGVTYQWLSGNTSLAVTRQIVLGQANADGNYQVQVSQNGCTSAPAIFNYQKQKLTSSYTIIAFDEVDLGENNTIASGSIGVTSPWGEVTFHKNSSASSPGSFVKAKYINKNGSNINITNPINSAATGIVLPTMYFNMASTNRLPTKEVAQNSLSTISGNYKSLILKKGSRTTITGNTFGTIRVEQGAEVTFTASTLNIDKLQVVKGPRIGYSYLHFAPDTKILISSSVTLGSQVYINPENYKVNFYLGDKQCDEEKFCIKGGDTKVTANIYIPKGKLQVTGGYSYGNYGNGSGDSDKEDDDERYAGQGNSYVYMTGLFIAEEVVGKGKNIIWNSFDCNAQPVALINAINKNEFQVNGIKNEIVITEEELKVIVLPNPSNTYFTLKLESKYETPINIRVMDANGRVVDAKSKVGANSTIQIGHNYTSGTYYAEIIQGTTRKVFQLIKARG